MTTRRWPVVAAGLVMLPAVLAHEVAHVLAASPWANDWAVASLVPPRLELTYPAGTTVAAVVAANLAPTVSGLMLTPAVFWWASSTPFPVAVYGIGTWLLFTLPSADDISVLHSVF